MSSESKNEDGWYLGFQVPDQSVQVLKEEIAAGDEVNAILAEQIARGKLKKRTGQTPKFFLIWMKELTD